jgi:hypothetical protein
LDHSEEEYLIWMGVVEHSTHVGSRSSNNGLGCCLKTTQPNFAAPLPPEFYGERLCIQIPEKV